MFKRKHSHFSGMHNILLTEKSVSNILPAMIELKSVTKKFGSLVAVDNVSFSVGTGEYFALLGPNGAGKTTVVRMLLDFTRPTSGSLSVDGLPAERARCRAAVGYLPENHRIPTNLSGWQYLQRCAKLIGLKHDEAEDQCMRIVELIGMQGREHSKSGTYSKGMMQRFGLGVALIGRPKLLILDEPASGLDPIGIRETRQLLESLKNQGMTLILNSHLLSEVEKICDSAAIINHGKLMVRDKISSLVKDGDSLEDVFVRLVKG
mgnify:CR=1 FL=1